MKRMNDVKGLSQEMRVQRIGSAYNSFVQSVGSIQFAGTMGTIVCAIFLAVNQVVNYVVMGQIVTS